MNTIIIKANDQLQTISEHKVITQDDKTTIDLLQKSETKLEINQTGEQFHS